METLKKTKEKSSTHLKGYILEEVISYLIRTSGYKLLTTENEDKDNLKDIPAGLAVRGKGGYHQADNLGQLNFVSAFTYPLRLFVDFSY